MVTDPEDIINAMASCIEYPSSRCHGHFQDPPNGGSITAIVQGSVLEIDFKFEGVALELCDTAGFIHCMFCVREIHISPFVMC